MSAELTPRPWTVEQTGQIEHSITGDDRALPLATGLYKEDAEFIVRAANSFDELVAALERSRNDWMSIYPSIWPKPGHFGFSDPGPECSCQICVIDTALARARGEAS